MPARDLNRDMVCNALRNDGCTITHDPYVIDYLAQEEIVQWIN